MIFFFLNGFCKNFLFCANQHFLSEFSFFPLFLFALNFTLIFSVFFFCFFNFSFGYFPPFPRGIITIYPFSLIVLFDATLAGLFEWSLVNSEQELSKHGKKEVYTVQTMELELSQPLTPGLPFNWIVDKSLPFLLQVLFLLRALYFGWEWVSRPCRPARGCESLCRPSRPAGCLQHGARHNLHFSPLDFYRCDSVSHPLNLYSWTVSNGLKLVYIQTR